VSRDLWRFDKAAPQWDALVLRSYVGGNGGRLCQEGSVVAMRSAAGADQTLRRRRVARRHRNDHAGGKI
jgi:hypothetical protein